MIGDGLGLGDFIAHPFFRGDMQQEGAIELFDVF